MSRLFFFSLFFFPLSFSSLEQVGGNEAKKKGEGDGVEEKQLSLPANISPSISKRCF